jgi:hypothetical protein
VRRSQQLLPVGGVLAAAIGLVLLVLEVARTVSGTPLGTLGTILLWVGVGLIAVGMLLLALVLSRALEPGEPTPPNEPTEPTASEPEPVDEPQLAGEDA